MRQSVFLTQYLPTTIEVSVDTLTQKIGTTVSSSEALDILSRLGFVVTEDKSS